MFLFFSFFSDNTLEKYSKTKRSISRILLIPIVFFPHYIMI